MVVEEGTENGDGTGCTLADKRLKGGAVNNAYDAAGGSSRATDGLLTYKRRKHSKLNSVSNGHEAGRNFAASERQLAGQNMKEHCGMLEKLNSGDCPLNGLAYQSHSHWRNAVLENVYRSLSDSQGGLEKCICDALTVHENFDRNAGINDGVTHKFTSPDGLTANGTREAARAEAGVVKLNQHGLTEKCEHAFANVLASQKFASLCKLLLENFPGIKFGSLLDFSLINSRMKEGAYENSPMLFFSDLQHVWEKLQGIGTELTSLANRLCDISRTAYHEQVGISSSSTLGGGKHESYPRKSDSCCKEQQIRDCRCRRCGEKAEGRDCLVCDTCEEMYHVSCIEPAVTEIPNKSWFCASCTASRIGSTHKDCVVCERLNASKALNNGGGTQILPMNRPTDQEVKESSNCSTDTALQQFKTRTDSCHCKICRNVVEDGEKFRICGHPYCPNKFYHARCLSSKQLKSYGSRWYCPSCLCRRCLTDRDDEKIVLCDGCDQAYHIYCMKPPRTSIPKRKWFCRKCDAGIRAIRRAKKAYEVLENNRKRKEQEIIRAYDNLEKKRTDEGEEEGGGMEMLLTAAKTLNFEENLAAL